MIDAMTSPLVASLLMAASFTLATLYLVCLIVGGGLLIVATVFGGDSDVGVDGDVGVDLDVSAEVAVDVDTGGLDVDGGIDAGADVAVPDTGHAPALSLANWFSVHFVVYFVAVFGLVGTALTHLSDLGTAPILLLALAAGVVTGQGVHQLLRWLHRTGGGRAITAAEFVDQAGRVTIAIDPPRKGEVSVTVRGRMRYVPAVASRADDKFKVGDEVIVVSYRNGTASVTSRREHEFLADASAK